MREEREEEEGDEEEGEEEGEEKGEEEGEEGVEEVNCNYLLDCQPHLLQDQLEVHLHLQQQVEEQVVVLALD